MRYLGLVSLTALLGACSSESSSPEPMNPATGATAGAPAATAGSGGMAGSLGGSESAGTTTGGVSGGSGGSPVGGTDPGSGDTIISPEGKIPNVGMPPAMVDLPRNRWTEGLTIPVEESLEVGHHQNQPIVVNGYVEGAGNAELVFYDISNPAKPVMLSRITSPTFDPNAGPKGVGEAESHQTSTARYGNKFYQVSTTGLGVDIWDITSVRDPKHLKEVALEGIDYGDFTDAVWGMYWQGTTIYVGGTNTGLHILDATNPENVTVVKRLPTSAFGGVSAGPLWAVGNTLVITTPKESGGIATMDISDPLNPVALASIKPNKSYMGGFYGKYAWLQGPMRAWDVLTDPTKISSSPAGTLSTEASEYTSFADGYLFLGHLRPNAGVSKINVKDVTNMQIERRVWGRLVYENGDDQFSIQVGSLLVLADDELPYRGMTIAAHSTEPDTTPPAVDTVVPHDGTTGLNIKSRVGISLTDNLELATVHPYSVIVRPVGGQPIKGTYGLYMGVLNFDPDEDLLPNTTYEVVLPQNGVKDLVGNGIAAEYTSTFTTGP